MNGRASTGRSVLVVRIVCVTMSAKPCWANPGRRLVSSQVKHFVPRQVIRKDAEVCPRYVE